jgi:hypothetical protein
VTKNKKIDIFFDFLPFQILKHTKKYKKMDLGYPYTEQEIKDRAARFNQLSKSLLCCRSIPDIKYNNNSNNSKTKKSDNAYTVEIIFKTKTRKVNRLKQYLVKWENYDETTWQFEYILIQDLGEEVFKSLLA